MSDYAIRAGVLGATGYTGRELCRLLAAHPRVEVVLATSQRAAGERVHAGASGNRLVRVEEADPGACELVFCCLPHGDAAAPVKRARGSGAAVIDLSADFRVPGEGAPPRTGEAVYGLSELNREEIRAAGLIANPGCYPTAALLALAPLLRRGLVAEPVIIQAASGATGAGRSPKRELLFGEVAEDFRAYAVGNTHRHLREMRHHAARLAGAVPELVFTPHLLPVRRGILETIYVPLKERLSESAACGLWARDYGAEPFVEVLSGATPSLADAVGSNRLVIGISPVADTASSALLLVAAIDNLLKGAAGQAVQNMNMMFGWPETEGLPC